VSTRRARLRYDRMAALLVSVGVTVFALLAGVGTFGPLSAEGGTTSRAEEKLVSSPTSSTATQAPAQGARTVQTAKHAGSAAEASAAATPAVDIAAASTADDPDGSTVKVAVPADSGEGRRIVFDMSDQRVWLVGRGGSVERTYLVSGSVTDNLVPGHYNVYSRSRHAVGVDDSGTMQYFVRFTRGNNAAIGFHDIPVDRGRPLQSERQLGTPQSHGCIRQARPDAIRLWDFAPVGTPVYVVA
jgi:lipoprotein-anchoring transpeptidase ErfK/SrfK